MSINHHMIVIKSHRFITCLLGMLMLCPLFALSETITANENQFNQVELSNNAIKKLGLEVREIRSAKALSSKLFPAQIGYAPQALTNYITPFNGYVDLNAHLHLGDKVKAGQPLLKIKPVVTPETRLSLLTNLSDTEGQLKSSQEQVEANRLVFNRARQLFMQHVGSQKSVDDAQANLAIAETNLNTVKQKHALLKQAVAEGASGVYEIKAARDGVITSVNFTSGQLLAGGSKLLDIVSTNQLLITVFVPQEQIKKLQLNDAWISDDAVSDKEIRLKKVMLPLDADPQTGMRKVMYISSDIEELAVMQKLSVNIFERAPRLMALGIPCSSIVVDMYGGEWIYLKEDETHFRRERVFVSDKTSNACLVKKPHLTGRFVVSQGAQELFALETGYTH